MEVMGEVSENKQYLNKPHIIIISWQYHL